MKDILSRLSSRNSQKSELPTGSGKSVKVNGKTIALFNEDRNIHAIDDTCVLRGGPLGEGEWGGNIVTCPLHGWQYNVTTGVCVNNPQAKVNTYPVKAEGDDILVALA